MRLIIAFLALLCFSPASASAQTIGPPIGPNGAAPVFPALDPTGTTNTVSALNTAIAAAIAAGQSSLDLIPGGTYLYGLSSNTVNPSGRSAGIFITGATNFTLDCHGSTLLYAGYQSGGALDFSEHIGIQNSTNVTLKNCVLDDKYPLAQTATELGTDGSTYVDFTFDAPVNWPTVQQIEQIVDPASATEALPAGYTTAYNLIWNYYGNGTYGGGNSINRTLTPQGGNVYRVAYTGNDSAAAATVVAGGKYLLMLQKNNADGVYAYNVSGLTLDNVRVYAAGGAAIDSYNCSNIRLVNGTGTYVAPGTTRLRSVNGDTHILNATGTFEANNFHAEGNSDDGLIVVSNAFSPASVASNTSFTYTQPFPYPSWAVGDTLEGYNSSMTSQGTATISSISCDGGTHICTVGLSSTGFAGLATSWYVGNRTQSPTKVVIRDGTFSRIRGHAIYVNARDVDIIGNSIDHTTQAGVSMANPSYNFSGGGALLGPVPQYINLVGNTCFYCNYENYVGTSGGGLGGDAGAFAFPARIVAGSSNNGQSVMQSLFATANTCNLTNNSCLYAGGFASILSKGNAWKLWGQNAATSAYTATGAISAVNLAFTAGGVVDDACATQATRYCATYASGFSGETVSIAQPPPSGPTVALAAAGSYTVPNGVGSVLFTGTSTYATYTITLPPNPTDKMRLNLNFQGTITTATITANTGQSLVGSVSNPVGPNKSVNLVYDIATSAWTFTN